MDNQTNLLNHGFNSTVLEPAGYGGKYLNQKIAIVKDLIFGLSVWTGDEWFPLSKADLSDLYFVHECINNDPLFLWYDDLNKIISEKKK